MALFNLEVDPLTIAFNGILQGIGSAIMWVPLSIVAFATLPIHLLPDASSIFHLLRNFGSSIFISVCVLAISRTGRISYSELAENITLFSDNAQFPQVMGLWSFDSVQGLAAQAPGHAPRVDGRLRELIRTICGGCFCGYSADAPC